MKSIYRVVSFDMISKVLLGILGILLIRYMLPSEYAIYTFAFSVITVVSQTITSAFRRIYIVGYTSFSIDKYKGSLLGLQLLLVLFFAIIYLAFRTKFDLIYLLTISMIIGYTLIEFIKTVYQQELSFNKFSYIEIARSTTFFFITLIFIYFIKFDIKAWHILLSQSITMIMLFYLTYWKKSKITGIFKFKRALIIAKEIVYGKYKYLIMYTLFVTLLGNLDVFMLKYISTNNELAAYGSAFRYYSLLLLVLNSINTVFLPVIQKVNSKNELNIIYKNHSRILMVFIPIVLLGAWLAEWIIPLIDMGKYPSAVPVFQILTFSAILSFAFSPHTNFVMKFEDFKYLLYVIIISVITNIVLNAFLIPVFGARGAAIATLVTFGFSNLMTYIRAKMLRKRL
jgi:O-antigen/teichoic acid export membrane protein